MGHFVQEKAVEENHLAVRDVGEARSPVCLIRGQAL